MITVQAHILELNDRLDSAIRLIDSTHPQSLTTGLAQAGPVSREARGLAVVLIFAAYENLLKSLTRTLLEAAIKCRVGNRRLQPRFQLFTIESTFKSARAIEESKLYTKGLPAIVRTAGAHGYGCTINPNSFPSDKSFFKSSQIEVWCTVFDIGHAPTLLPAIWPTIDTVVSQRNAIAHGQLKAGDVGRTYTETEIRDLVENWRKDWTSFLSHVNSLASSRDFFRTPK